MINYWRLSVDCLENEKLINVSVFSSRNPTKFSQWGSKDPKTTHSLTSYRVRRIMIIWNISKAFSIIKTYNLREREKKNYQNIVPSWEDCSSLTSILQVSCLTQEGKKTKDSAEVRTSRKCFRITGETLLRSWPPDTSMLTKI